jgi:RND family efflux transporter MFP subunit
MRRLIFLNAILVASLGAMLPGRAFAESHPGARHEVVITIGEQQIRAAGVETHPIERELGTGELVVPGTVAVPPQQLRIVATPAAGLVETLLVAVDQDVKEGDPIARLKSSELVEAQRAFLHAVADANLAEEKLRRDEQLYKEHIIAERRLIVTRAETVQARSTLDERSQLLALAGMTEAEIELLRRDRKLASTLLVRAPMAGTILARHGTAGERIPAAAPLVTIARLDPIWVNLQIPIGRAMALEDADHVVLRAVGVDGRLIRIGRSVDSATQSITAVAEFKLGKSKSAIRPGQAIQAILRLSGAGGPQWRVPADAVVNHRDQNWVFVRTEKGFRATPVTLVAETPHYASIRGTLNAADRVATRGILTLLAELAAADK